ncbi:MAG: two-component regulator propeller domain-containing protein [Mangrovibacterium sp.]
MRISTLLLAFCLCSSIFAANSHDTYRFRTLSPEGGFYYDGVKQIQQDVDGFIWIMMENDLYRFDGYQHKRYYAHFANSNKSVEWIFGNMAADKHGQFLVNTNNGLYKYTKANDDFVKVFDTTLSAIKIDNHHIVWGRNNKNWHMLNLENGEMITPKYDSKEINSISPVFCTYNDDLYLLSNSGEIYRFNYAKQEFTLCFSMAAQQQLIADAKVHKGKMWILTQEQTLYKLDLSTFTIEEQLELFQNESLSIRQFHIDKNGNVWIGTIKGLYIYHPDTKELSMHETSINDPFSLPNNSIWTINEDWQKNIWIGTFAGGLCYVNLDEQIPFKTYLPKEGELSLAPVSAFAEDNERLWIGTEGGGLNCLNKATGQFSYYTTHSASQKISSDNIKSLVIDKKQNLWISTYNGGLNFLDLERNSIQHFKHSKSQNSILENNIRKLVAESDSGIWIAYQRKQLVISFYSFEKNIFSHHHIDKDAQDQYIFDMVKGSGNQLWILTAGSLYLMDIDSKAMSKIQKNDSTFMNFHTCCLDDSGNLWIGTIGNGLIKYNPNSSKFTAHKKILDLNTASIYSICHDDSGNLWMGTENGLAKYNIANDTFSKYDKKDGSQGQAYYPISSMKGLDGKLYFGGTNGLTIINPSKLTPNKHLPKVIISDFLIDHKSTKSSLDNYSSNEEILLNYDQMNFGFQFSSDNYLIPEKNRFKYRLKGYDNRWVEVDASNRTALYSKVPAGTYYFEVMASNNDGVWSNKPTSIKIKRRPAPWASWYAYLAYFIAIASLGYFIYKYYSEKKRLNMQLYLENIEKDKQDQIHQAQLRFFTNISHDFRTPLSLIIAAADRLREEGLKEYYYRILHSNSQRLLNLVNELMDFRTVENGKMKRCIEAVDVNACVKEWAADFIDYAKQRDIEFMMQFDPRLPARIYLDKHILEKTVMNLLNNAFKYTKKGRIVIKTLASADDFAPLFKNKHVVQSKEFPSHAFALVVEDSGVGISKDSIASVFERFYKVNTVNSDSHLGTGIGLALVKSLILLHKGAISLHSERHKGTEIAVFLSLDKNIYPESDFVQAKESNLTKPTKEENTDEIQLEDDFLLRDKRRILFAEDNQDLRQIITETLSEQYEIIEAPDGEEASKIIENSGIDLLISDIMMPIKDGVMLCHEVKNNINTSHIPVILLTAKTSVESKIEGLDSGADIYLEKPIDINLLKLSIQNIFNHQEQLKEYYAKNHFVDSAELASNEHDNKFLKKFVDIIETNIDHSEMDVNYIASELSMSRSKLYNKVKSITGKSIVEFILGYRLRKAARLLIEEDMTIREIIAQIGIESQPYFTNAFKKEFGETPSAFAAKRKKKK